MNLGFSVLVFIPVILVTGYVTQRAWVARDAPGGRFLFYTYAGVLVWLCCYAIELNLTVTQWKVTIAQVEYLGIATSPVFYVLFTAEYTRGFRPSKWQYLGLFAVPILTIVLVWTNPTHQLVWTNYEIRIWNGLSLAHRQFQPWFYVHLVYSYTAFLVGLILFVDVITDRNFFFRRQSAAILLGSLVPIGTALIYPLGLSPIPGFDFFPFGLAINGALFGYAFFSTEFYDIIPAIRAVGWERMADQIDSGIIVTDVNTIIIEVNQPIHEMFGTSREEVIGQPVTVLFEDTAIDETVDGAYEFTKSRSEVFEVQWSAVQDRHGHRIGYTYTVTDITERKRREQQLQVLNRTLRHNLRNKVNVISAHSERIERATEDGEGVPDVHEDAVDITRAANRIDEIGQTARRVEQLIGNTSVERIALDTAVETSIEAVRQQYPEANIVNEVTDEILVEACPDIEHAFEQLLENSFQHNDPAETKTTITVERGITNVSLRFSDDGDGIPEHELQTIENGKESALEHASGLGLWFVKWIIEASGGEIHFETSSAGTTVEIVLVRARDETV